MTDDIEIQDVTEEPKTEKLGITKAEMVQGFYDIFTNPLEAMADRVKAGELVCRLMKHFDEPLDDKPRVTHIQFIYGDDDNEIDETLAIEI